MYGAFLQNNPSSMVIGTSKNPFLNFTTLTLVIFLAFTDPGVAETPNKTLTPPVSPEPTLEGQPPKNKPLVWAFSELPPFKIKSSRGEQLFDGIDYAVLTAVAKALNAPLKIYECPLKRCLELARTGDIDILSAVALREDRKDYLEFIEPPYNRNNAKIFYIKKGSQVRIDRYEDIKKYKIGTKNGAAYFPQFDRDLTIKREPVNDILLNLRKLDQGRIDAAINTEIQMDWEILTNGLEGRFEKSNFRDDSGMSYLALSKSSPFMRNKEKIAQTIRSLVDSGEMKSIVDDFFTKARHSSSKPPVQTK